MVDMDRFVLMVDLCPGPVLRPSVSLYYIQAQQKPCYTAKAVLRQPSMLRSLSVHLRSAGPRGGTHGNGRGLAR